MKSLLIAVILLSSIATSISMAISMPMSTSIAVAAEAGVSRCPSTEGMSARKKAAQSCDDLESKTQQESCRLGRELFSNNELSFDNQASCASCHHAQKAYGDGLNRPELRGATLSLSRTIRLLDLSRRSEPYFWNGRAHSLQGAIYWPLYQGRELGADAASLAKFGGEKRVSTALAAYLSTINSADAPWDRYLAGDCTALTTTLQAGARLFQEKRCTHCHRGSELAGDAVSAYTYEDLPQDFFNLEEARYGQDWELHKTGLHNRVTLQVKAPTLRNIAPPYGQFGQSSDLLHYVEGHEKQLMHLADPSSKLTDRERRNLVDFLREALSSPHP